MIERVPVELDRLVQGTRQDFLVRGKTGLDLCARCMVHTEGYT